MTRGSRQRQEAVDRQRSELAERIERGLELPMLVLALTWLALLVVEFAWTLTPVLDALFYLVWILFVLEYALRFALAPHKTAFVRRTWLTLISLPIPALRFLRAFQALRVLRVARTMRGIRLARVVTSANRGMRSLASTLGRRRFGYVVGLTTIVTFAGAAGMIALERPEDGGGIEDFGHALWWTAMIITTMGTDYWPRTGAGRLLCLLLAVYAFAVFGYVTATIATFFIGRDAERDEGDLASSRAIAALRNEIAALRAELRERSSKS